MIAIFSKEKDNVNINTASVSMILINNNKNYIIKCFPTQVCVQFLLCLLKIIWSAVKYNIILNSQASSRNNIYFFEYCLHIREVEAYTGFHNRLYGVSK